MKNIIFFILLTLFLSLHSFAQKRFQVGIKAGGYEFKAIKAGILGELKIVGPLSIQTGAHFLSTTKKEELQIIRSIKKVSWGFEVTTIGTDYAILRTSHIIVPIQLKLVLGKKKITPYIMSGVVPSFMLSSVATDADKKRDIEYIEIENSTFLYFPETDPANGLKNDMNKKADISKASPSYDTRLINSVGIDIRLEKVTPFIEFQFINRLKNNANFQQPANLLLMIGLKI